MSTGKINAKTTQQVIKHIDKTWDQLTISYANILDIALDPKSKEQKTAPPTICVPRTDDFDRAYQNIKDQVPKQLFAKLSIEPLHKNHLHTKSNAMLYLPNPYISPGGRFSEMYGWDSFFIILGLLKSNRYQMAKNIAENLLYEIHHYGMVLNANRGYCLTRSQPPVLSSAILAIYHHKKDKTWLRTTVSDLEKFHQHWTSGTRAIPNLGLSRYYAASNKPLPDAEEGYHDYVKHFYKHERITCYNVNRFYDRANHKLKPAFYRADRTVRESGFDLSNKFGPFGADILSYAPVSLNSLLCITEQNLAEIHHILNNPVAEKKWGNRAKKRAALINDYCFEPALGHYFDYNHVNARNRLYIYATTFYPLAAGIASKEQATRVIQNLPALESNGGIMSSAYVTGMQWDATFGWAPHQYFTLEALKQYGAMDDAKRIATKFISMINDDFSRTGCLYEKYDMVRRTSDVVDNIKFGYKINVKGFGWTNAIYLHLLDFLR